MTLSVLFREAALAALAVFQSILDASHASARYFAGNAQGRMAVVRTFIALPAGLAEMDRTKFHVYTFLGSLPWCLALAWVGYKLGEKWNTLGAWFHRFDLAIGLLILAGAVWFVRDHLKHRSRG